MKLSRRSLLRTVAIGGVGALSFPFFRTLNSAAASMPLPALSPITEFDLFAAPASFQLLPGTTTHGLGFNGQIAAPVIRGKQGQPLRIRFHNRLDEPTTIHWHGVRLPLAMDGVPDVTQAPILPGESFIYEFTPPDAGTFWYHPHVNSIEQLGRGLVGPLVIDEAEDPGFDQDLVLLLKNWNLQSNGEFGELSVKRYAARQGTPGQTFSVNGQSEPEYAVHAGAAVRLRLINADNTWPYELTLQGAPAQILSKDANPIVPERFEGYTLGAGMRLDLGLLVPNQPGQVLELKHKHKVLARLIVMPSTSAPRLTLPRLPENPIAEPDLNQAEKLFFSFEWDAISDEQGRALFWNLKGPKAQRPAYCTNANLLASLARNKSYIFTLRNNTQYPHPIHLHGHTFKVLESDKRPITPYYADTVLLEKHEQVSIAFVADNPGRWMFHCHVIEHMAMGLVGMIEVV
ncbi:MAG: multicopper oxidase family protein [Hahellaceae bacterium]|nr:multicopper oxidase family protein [Hahellaceae bacterium]MCP5169395.1 multicopper oxidase family protein [Hahellaceae bacterium]